MAIPHSTTGSLGPAFASARLVGLTVSLAYIHVLDTRLPTGLSQTSLCSSLRQRSTRYTIRAGRNLPDKEFRYLRTVIVTADIHGDLGSQLRLAANRLP